MHVRRTDQKNWLAKYVGGKLIAADYFNLALSLMRRRHREALFVVSSDGREWCRLEPLGPDVLLAGDEIQTQPGGDMALLADCNHAVLTHGSTVSGRRTRPVERSGYGTKQANVEYAVRKANLNNWIWINAFTVGGTSKAANSGKRM